jgi:hypothetical protein
MGSLILFLKGKKNSQYLAYLNENTNDKFKENSLVERIWYYINDINEHIICECGERVSFIGAKEGWKKTCGKKECVIKARQKTCVEKYGVSNVGKKENITKKKVIAPLSNLSPAEQNKIFNEFMLKIDGVEVNSNNFDYYISQLKTGIDFNNLKNHCELYKDKNYHINKTKECAKNNITLFHVWEDDWIYKQDIIKSMILNKINLTNNKLFARKCVIKEILDNKLVKDFLVANHIQGFVGSKVKIGLFYNEELISIMTFGNLRRSLGQKTEEGQWELLRFCNKVDTSVIGGASKLLSYFLKNYIVKEIISYSDLSRSDGNMYQKLGFTLSHNSDPNYYYIIDGIRKHRFNYRKDKLVREGGDPNLTEIEIMHKKGLYRIFDCGMQKWIYRV